MGSKVDLSSGVARERYEKYLELIDRFEQIQMVALEGGGERYIKRHLERGKLLARDRIEAILDEGSYFLELSTLAAYGSTYSTGASVIVGIGVVEGVEVLLVANDPTIKGGATNPFSLKKSLRALEIAKENRLPVIYMVESGGADLPTQSEIFIPGGATFRDLTQLSALAIPTIALVFGNSTAGGAYLPGMCDYAVLVEDRAKVFLGGPPLVYMATGEISDDESLGGARMHSEISGLGDYLASDELDAIAIGREIVESLGWKKLGKEPRTSFEEPLFDMEEILGLIPTDYKDPLDSYEVIARLVDGSLFSEYKALYGTNLVCGFATIAGFEVGIIANHKGVIFSEEAKKATEFIMISNQRETPLIFLTNTTGFIVGKAYEENGIIKDGAKMINAVANSKVPHITVNTSASFGAGNYGMSGRAFNPRFVFSWPNAKSAVMGAAQLAGVLSIVARESTPKGQAFDEEADQIRRQYVEDQITKEQEAFFMSGRLYDDGVIDPRDTRSVLTIVLSAINSNTIEGTRAYGVFRM
ncbi:MAG: acyl-CoA carboxylase subunit beta [Actinomycetota bacterium]|nr:acyl-CoA carboxylase subunit beta [Actinomycetota bacterium]